MASQVPAVQAKASISCWMQSGAGWVTREAYEADLAFRRTGPREGTLAGEGPDERTETEVFEVQQTHLPAGGACWFRKRRVVRGMASVACRRRS